MILISATKESLSITTRSFFKKQLSLKVSFLHEEWGLQSFHLYFTSHRRMRPRPREAITSTHVTVSYDSILNSIAGAPTKTA